MEDKKREMIDSILLTNWYLTQCELEDKNSQYINVTRKYLTSKISSALIKTKTEPKYSFFSMFF